MAESTQSLSSNSTIEHQDEYQVAAEYPSNGNTTVGHQTENPVIPLTFDPSPAEQTLDRYFKTLNAGDFAGTASLFAEDGVMHPPFESGMVGQEAIVDYLNKDAQGLHIIPLRKTIESLDSGDVCYKIVGTAQTALFSVNVGWNFVLNDSAEICSVEVKLLAALKELLTLKR
ncbi:YybH family protein [Egbenema bharatensis]|uniref:YybH family protein n=1 Tax=Egbenema bharatensis TaxID=3463334 RepID=UPI003A884A91